MYEPLMKKSLKQTSMAKKIEMGRTDANKVRPLVDFVTIQSYLMMYSVKSVRPVLWRDVGRSPGDGDTFPRGLVGTELFSATALVRTRLIWRNLSSQLHP